jgi:biopolymer transport protein ExbB
MDLLISGGVVLLAIVAISVYAVYLFFVRLFKLSKERMDTDELMARVNAAVRDRDLDLALDACEQHGGPVARVLQAALLRLPYGRQAVEAAFAEASLLEEQSLTRGLRPLATIAQVAPLLGLLGTVTGMIIAFGEISASGTGNPGLLAGGIGQALVTTAAGLIVAIPVLIGQNYLASRVDAILTEIDRRREELMANVVQAVAARKDTTAAAEETAPAAAPARPGATTPTSSATVRPRATTPAPRVPRIDGAPRPAVTPAAVAGSGALFTDVDRSVAGARRGGPTSDAHDATTPGGTAQSAASVSPGRAWVDEEEAAAVADASPLIGRAGRLRVERFGDGEPDARVADPDEGDLRDQER